jgi:hypothetical protein
MTSLGGKVGMFLLGGSVNEVAKTECNTNIRNLRGDTTSSVEDCVVGGTSEWLLFKGRQDVGDNTLIKKEQEVNTDETLFLFASIHTLWVGPPI